MGADGIASIKVIRTPSSTSRKRTPPWTSLTQWKFQHSNWDTSKLSAAPLNAGGILGWRYGAASI